MAEHTSGPWDFALAEPDIRLIGIYANDGETIICDVTSEDLQVADQLGANARLIAAAPDLLAVCEELDRFVGSDYRQGRGVEIIKKIRDAIAKAKGSS